MGNIIGGIVGGVGSYFAGQQQAKAIREAGRRAERIFGQAKEDILGLTSPFIEGGTTANQAVLDALGQGDPGAQDAAFQNFLGSTGYRSQLAAGQQAITGSAAASGLLNSGATLKSLNRFGQGLAQQGFTNFLGNLQTVAGRGAASAGTTAGAIGQLGAGAAGAAQAAGTQAAGAQASGTQGALAGAGQAFQGFGNYLGGRTDFFGNQVIAAG